MRPFIRNAVSVNKITGPSLSYDFMTKSLDPTVGGVPLTFSRNSIGTYFDSARVRQYASANQPRWDYDPVTGAFKGLLMENTRTNLFLNSDTPVTQTITVVTGTRYVVWMEGTGSVVITTGTAVLTNMTNSGNVVPGQLPANYCIINVTTGGTVTCTVSGATATSKVQFENGSEPSSYISSGATAYTRVTDTLSTAASGTWFNPNEGTYIVEASSFITNSSLISGCLAELSDGGTGNRLTTLREPGYFGNRFVNATLGFSFGFGGVWNPNVIRRIALAYKPSDYFFSYPGSAVSNFGTPTVPLINKLSIGNNAGGSQGLCGWLVSFDYYPKRLPASQIMSSVR